MKNIFKPVLMSALVMVVIYGRSFAATIATPPATITVTAGSLSITEVNDIVFPSLALDGDDHDVAAATGCILTLTDATGSGLGWNITMQSTDFTASGGKTIPASQFKFTSGGTIVKTKGQQVNATYGPKETGLSSATLEQSRKVVTTAAGYGKGTYTYTPTAADFVVTVTADALAGSYAATVTVSIMSGP